METDVYDPDNDDVDDDDDVLLAADGGEDNKHDEIDIHSDENNIEDAVYLRVLLDIHFAIL